MKTFFENYCADNGKSVDDIFSFCLDYAKQKDYNQFIFKRQNNSHDFGDYDSLDIYINMIEPDWDTDNDDNMDDLELWDMYIDQAKDLSNKIQKYIYDTN